MLNELPTPAFQHFERVIVRGTGSRCSDFQGDSGTIIALESSAVLKTPVDPGRWTYVVQLPARGLWKAFFQSDLESAGGVDRESDHLATRPEISFDLAREEGMTWMEGSYRLPGELWKVVIFRQEDVPAIESRPQRWREPTPWEREATGVLIRIPRSVAITRTSLLGALSQVFGHADWTEVRGPDSMLLR